MSVDVFDDLAAVVEATHEALNPAYVGVWETCAPEAFDEYLAALGAHVEAIRAMCAVVAS